MAGSSDYDLYTGENIPYTNFIKDALSQGRVEICKGGMYGTICADGWDNLDATVVCTEMGFSPYGKNSDEDIDIQDMDAVVQF